MTEQFIIQSDTDNLPLVEERLFHFCHEFHVGRYYSAVSVATMQAVKNAIEHGNQCHPEKCVEVTFGTCRGGICVEVADEGKGFDYSRYGTLSDDTSQGEGIFVMKQLADRIEFSKNGSRVRLEFVVDGIDPADAIERAAVIRSHYHMYSVA